jgi:four helix bundle protein
LPFVTHFRELRVHQQAFDLSMRIFKLSRKWLAEERYSLTNQIGRSSRSVCANVAEAWRKRRYQDHFVSKLSDADGELAETENWLMFALACEYLSKEHFDELWAGYEQVSGGLVNMMSNPDTWCGPSHLAHEADEEYVINSESSPGIS